jgi:hypothetical protein
MVWPTLALVALSACRDRAARPPTEEDPEHPRMADVEQQRAVQICEGYVARLCACAAKERDAALAEQCDLARGQPEAVRLDLALLHGIVIVPDAGEKHTVLNANERRVTEAALRKVVAACAQADAALDPARCPRLAPPASR